MPLNLLHGNPRPPPEATVLDELRPSSTTKTLDIPEVLNKLCPAGKLNGEDVPKFQISIDPECCSPLNQMSDVKKEAEVKKCCFIFITSCPKLVGVNSIKCTTEKLKMKQQLDICF